MRAHHILSRCLLVLILLSVCCAGIRVQSDAEKARLLDIERRIGDIIGSMTTLDKARQLDMHSGSEFIVNGQINDTLIRSIMATSGVSIIHDFYPPTAHYTNDLQRINAEQQRRGQMNGTVPILFLEECLHGLEQGGHTNFPAALNLGATFNPLMAELLGAATRREVRAYGIRWCLAPVLGPTREPRWGRSEETIGEDPFLVASMAQRYVRGLQGATTNNASVVSEPKHYAAHSAPEGGRNTAVAHMGLRELEDTFLPGFRAAIEEGALGVMAAYSETDGIPCTSSDYLLKTKLRDEWGFQGFVLSDLGAISMLHDTHHIAATPKDAIVIYLNSGGNCQFYDFTHDVWEQSIVAAIADGSLTTEVLNSRVADVLRVKMLLELDTQPYTDPQLVERDVSSIENQEIALRLALESIILLKNNQSLLPINIEKYNNLAIIGPCANRLQIADYSGPDTALNFIYETTLLQGITEYINITSSPNKLNILHHVATYISNGDHPIIRRDNYINNNVNIQFYNNLNLSGNPVVTRYDKQIDYNWYLYGFDRQNTNPLFSARLTGQILFDITNPNTLIYIDGDSNGLIQLYWDNQIIIKSQICNPCSFHVPSNAGDIHSFVIEYSQQSVGGSLSLSWDRVVDENYAFNAAITAVKSADITIVAVGDGSDGATGVGATSGEGLDRTDLTLLSRQEELVLAAIATGKPVVVILFSGRAPAIPNIANSATTIIEAFSPGQAQGEALASVLFGKYNPAGRLPITYPQNVGQLPIFYNYKPSARPNTYIDLSAKTTPVFVFGYGLSYSTFIYSGFTITPQRISPNGQAIVSFMIKNNGPFDGDDVPQLYITDQVSTVTQPIIALKGFERVRIANGATVTITFTIDAQRHLSLYNRTLQWSVEAGNFTINVGPSSNRFVWTSWVFVTASSDVHTNMKTERA